MISIVAADSGCAELDEKFRAKNIISTSAVYLEYPYKHPSAYICENQPFAVDSPEYIIRELALAGKLAERYRPNEIHLDVSLHGLELSSITRETLENSRISPKGKNYLLRVLDRLRELGIRIKEEVGSSILLLGKESWAVRIAELNTASCAIKYGVEKLLENELGEILIGLPKRSFIITTQNFVISKSLYFDEQDLFGFIKYSVPNNIKIDLFPNPTAMGFYIARITRND